MCGIFGIFDSSGADENLLLKMSDVTRHRGPDDRGFFLDGPFGFGMNRLSIIDVAGGHQPIFNESENLGIVFNGEIYNFRAIGEGLKAKGHTLRTHSDTETILHLFEEKRENAFPDIDGMFAIALWDKNKKELTLCRDRLGKKPLYYYNRGGCFAFASEIKALLTLPLVSKSINLKALDSYLTHQYIPGPMTIFEDIHKLQPGCYLKFAGGSVEIREYWKLPAYTSDIGDEKECIRNVKELLRNAVKARLISEVPIGAFLSGGLDSSAIVAMMSEISDRPVKTFAVGFEESGYNELEFARTVATQFGTDHHEIVVKADAAELLPKIVWHMDEPVVDPAAIPTYLISEYARKYVTVVLTGEGGDEAFAGYSSFRHQRGAYYYQAVIPKFIRQLSGALADKVVTDRKIRQGLWCMSQPLELQGAAWRILFTQTERDSLYSNEVLKGLLDYDSSSVFEKNYRNGSGSFMDRMLQSDTKAWLPDDLLMKVDKMSMAHSLEARAPFLDHRLIEYMARIPMNLKLKGREGKYILKKAMEGILPDSIIYRKKHGFDLPLDRWLREDLKVMVDDLLSEEKIKKIGLFKPETVREIVVRQRRGERWLHKQVWALLVFQLWYERFMH